MYITISDVIGEETIDLSYPIRGTEVAVVSLFSDNIQYWLKKPIKVSLYTGEEKTLSKGVYAKKELNALLGTELTSTKFIDDVSNVLKQNKLEGISEIVLSLDELDNTDNLENGKSSSTLLTYHVTAYDDFTNFEPCTPQYKKLKNEKFNSLTLRITHKKNNVITNGPGTTVVLHVK